MYSGSTGVVQYITPEVPAGETVQVDSPVKASGRGETGSGSEIRLRAATGGSGWSAVLATHICLK